MDTQSFVVLMALADFASPEGDRQWKGSLFFASAWRSAGVPDEEPGILFAVFADCTGFTERKAPVD